MQSKRLFLNSFVRRTVEGKDYPTMDILFPNVEAYIGCATGILNKTNMTVVHRLYSDIAFKVVSQNYGWGWFEAELENVCRRPCACKLKVVNMFSLVYSSGLFGLEFYFSYNLIEDISRSTAISALEASPYKQVNASIKAAHRHTSKRRAMWLSEMVYGIDQIPTSAPWKTCCKRIKIFTNVFIEKKLRIRRDRSYLVSSGWIDSFGDMGLSCHWEIIWFRRVAIQDRFWKCFLVTLSRFSLNRWSRQWRKLAICMHHMKLHLIFLKWLCAWWHCSKFERLLWTEK